MSRVAAVVFAVLFPVTGLVTGCVTDDAAVADEPARTALWESLGPAQFSDAPSVATADFESAGARSLAQSSAPPDPDGVYLRVADVHDQREYRVRMDREVLRAVSAAGRARGFERGSMPAEGDRPDVVTHDGWSGNDDSRIRFTNTTAWPYRAVGTLFDGGSDCTGTRIGPRHVLTAAHCIYNKTSNSWHNIIFKPGRNGTASAPYGSSGPHWYWVPDEYITQATSVNNGYDIGLIILDTAVGNGWMGYGAWSASTLDEQVIFMRGYPRCNTGASPAGCEPKTLWGDTKRCQLGTYFDTDADGWNRQIETNCDGSVGQSGSSFYFYTTDDVPVSTGVFSAHYCGGGCPESEHNLFPNVITRITPTYLDVINWFRAEYQ